MKRLSLFLACLTLLASAQAQDFHYSVRKIWGGDAYCSFTSLVKYKGRFYCSFREGESHVFDENGIAAGRTRIISSRNGRKWTSVYLGSKEGYDLRDPKLSVMPDGRLMAIMGGSIYKDKQFMGMHPHVCFSSDGKTFSEPKRVTFTDGKPHDCDWLWRVTWHEGTGYAVDYGTDPEGTRFLKLYATRDGLTYDWLADLDVPDFPNETTVRFLPDGQMALMVRRDAGDGKGYWGVSEAPYTSWTWKKMDLRLGGQDFLVWGDNKILMSSRNISLPRAKTAIFKGNLNGKVEEVLVLPSGGDTSYPGLLIEGNELWVSYYSTHEGPKASIYLARIPLKNLE